MATYAAFRLGACATPDDASITNNPMWQELRIGGYSVGFLRDTLRSSTHFLQCAWGDDIELWRLTFFKNLPYEIVIEVEVAARGDVFNANAGLLGKAIWLQLDTSSETASGELVERASQWLRGSSTLTASDFTVEGQRQVAIDAKGIAFLSAPVLESTFRRVLILQALAYAYQTVMQGLSQELVASLSNQANTRDIYKKLVMFNAQCFFTSPVKLSNIALPDIWRRLREKFSIDESNAEITRQVADVAQLLAEQAREETRMQEKATHELALQASAAAKREEINRVAAQAKQDRSLRFWGRAVTAFLVLVSILQGLQATPSQVYENLKLWKALVF